MRGDIVIRKDDIAPIVASHDLIDANAKKLVAWARINPNDAAYRLCRAQEETMTGGSDGGGAPHKEIVCTAGDDVQSKALESN